MDYPSIRSHGSRPKGFEGEKRWERDGFLGCIPGRLEAQPPKTFFGLSFSVEKYFSQNEFRL